MSNSALPFRLVRRLTTAAAVAAVIAAPLRATAEDWPGQRGGGARHNASEVSLAPDSLTPLWQRSFRGVPIRDQEGPQDEMHLAAARGSLNLAIAGGHVALLAADASGPEQLEESYYLTVLDAAEGRTVNCTRVVANMGNERVYRWPYAGVSSSADTPYGLAVIHWDPQSGILFTGQGGYHSGYTAYRPLANADSYDGTPQPGVPAYASLRKNHPGLADPFGRTAEDFRTIIGTSETDRSLQPWAWGPSAFLGDPDNPESKKFDADWKPLHGRQGSSFYNTSAFFSVDPASPLMVMTKGAGWAHNTAGHAYLFNKHTGFKAVAEYPHLTVRGTDLQLRPFTSRGGVVANGRVFLAGPGQDLTGGELGAERPEGRLPKIDQGLALWAYDVVYDNRQPDDGHTGPGSAETARLIPAFQYAVPSAYEPDPDDIDSFGQSYYETDGFFRPKAMLADGKDLWFAWKPAQAGPVELLRAGDDGLDRHSLDVGRGAKGVDLWPKLGLTTAGGRKTLVYYTGYARHRQRYIPEDPETVLKQYTHKGNRWEDLSDADRKAFLEQARAVGIWSDPLGEPRTPAAVSVFDADSGRVRWTFDLSAHAESLPASGFWSYIDRSHLIVAGSWAYVGWVDTSGESAALRLVGLDLTADAPGPIDRTVPLDFPSEGNEGSVLLDLAAADGRLYGLVLEAENFWIRDPRWKRQHVIALGEAGE
ncbi:MAG: hypothetical protein ACLFVN_11315 [Phycisphaeraceae bacterium]